MTKTTSFDPTILDGASLYDAGVVIAERFGRTKVTLEYSKLCKRLNDLRATAGWREASLSPILLSINPNSEGQQRFQSMLRHSGFEPDVIHYRDTFVSLPPGRSPSEATGKPIKPMASLAPRIAYIAGLIALHADSDPQFLVVSHSFELYGPLTDLAHRVRKGKVGIAYFASLLDYRWKATGLLDKEQGGDGSVKFFDLDPYGKELLGVDLGGAASAHTEARAGLSRF